MSQTICDICGSPMKLIPAGVSRKNNKPYNAFYSCSQRCGYIWKPQTKVGGDNNEVLDAHRKTYAKLLEIEKKIDDFMVIFAKK